MDWSCSLSQHGSQCVTDLMKCRHFSILCRNHHIFSADSHLYSVVCELKVIHRGYSFFLFNFYLTVSNCIQNCYVYHILDVSSTESCCPPRQVVRVDTCVKAYFFQVVLQNLFTPPDVWQRYVNDLVEPTRPLDCRV